MKKSFVVAFLLFASFPAQSEQMRFLVFGDWGMGNEQQKAVAKQMKTTAASQEVQFVVNVGDNFYKTTVDSKGNREGGITNLTDSLWQTYFEQVYNSTLKNLTFYSILGNHDYMGNASAQLLYHKLDSRWVMPDRNYTVRFSLNNDTGSTALFVFIDTSPFIGSYYTDPENPTMKQQLDQQNYKEQLTWLNETLRASKDEWKFVVGHHPIYSAYGVFLPGDISVSMEVVKPVLQDNGVAAYFCGHVHKLQHLQQDGIDFFISGAGATGKVYVEDPNMIESVVWSTKDAGFMTVELDDDQMVSQFINTEGTVIHSATTKRPTI
ncbi:tartrate-resistant acid phosphatase type 5-like [Oscarella lobularis]|uniref:tartrate-resistant acid phosphatase type 5-like n=1 Tax=Oscarella lobularis TaxID=121494 RepID=UPI0033139464